MRRLMGVLVVTMLASPAMVSGQAVDANKVLTEMQAALGGTEKLAAIKTLTVEGMLRRVTPRGTLELTMELALELPDKYVTRTQLTAQGNMSVYRNAGFNGDDLINRAEAPPNLAGAGRDRARSDRAAMAQTNEQSAATAQRQLMNAKSDFARLALGLFGASYEGFPVQLSYAGLAESPDGNAHVIGAQGADGFEARLFVSAETNLPLMVTWSQALPRDPNTMQEHRIYYSNFKTVNDVSFPHTWRRSVDGNVTAETTLEQIEINPEIDSKKFEISR